MNAIEVLLISVYLLAMVGVLLFSFGQLHLAWLYGRDRASRSSPHTNIVEISDQLPLITVQLPVYNEPFVVDRLLEAIVGLDWPAGRMEIQVLDDSDDGTTGIIAAKIARMQDTAPKIQHIQRPTRTGFKAGALQNGLDLATGSYIAIFDADFVPRRDFLRRAMALFKSEHIGMVQVRWGHLNKRYSLLTRLQAFGLDSHFTVEQSGRLQAGSFINFNGTAGIWRRQCIVDAGGWQPDTIAEDLDLSYRAQLRGWKFAYMEDYQAPAELPITLSAVKTQQFRWTKGGTENARKNLMQVLRSDLGLQKKVHAFFHLTGSINFLLIFIASMVSIPLLLIKSAHPQYDLFFHLMAVFILGFLAISWFYWIATKHNFHTPGYAFVRYYPLFIMFYMGLALHNSVAVIQGLTGRHTPFVRTPKYNIVGTARNRRHRMHKRDGIGIITVFEALLTLYFLAGVLASFILQDYGLVLFHGFLAAGYAMLVYFTFTTE
jgi:cellulose synthase/poly-beta-1,6-N-acetylglucosamine synthase-like glycosyltransferase